MRILFYLRALWLTLFPNIPDPEAAKKRIRARTRNIVARLSRGNFLLRQGKYCTAEDVRERREALAKVSFDPPTRKRGISWFLQFLQRL